MLTRINIAALLAALTFGAGAAHAGVIITSATNGGGPSDPNASILTFDGSPLGNATQSYVTGGPTVTLSFTGDGKIVQGAQSGVYAEPYPTLAGPDTTHYVTTGIGTATFLLSSAQTYFGLLWGSVDSYNSLSFYDAGNNLLGTFTGNDVTQSANGNQGYNGTFYVNFSSTVGFTKVVASSRSYAFEIDNVAVDPPAAPEPGTLALFGAALLGLLAVRKQAKA